LGVDDLAITTPYNPAAAYMTPEQARGTPSTSAPFAELKQRVRIK
jgi:hypothetical protein